MEDLFASTRLILQIEILGRAVGLEVEAAALEPA
jgi:hypothetical protein